MSRDALKKLAITPDMTVRNVIAAVERLGPMRISAHEFEIDLVEENQRRELAGVVSLLAERPHASFLTMNDAFQAARSEIDSVFRG
ncbi:MAG: hypothetical protein HKN18_01795 [Silicimonas sp.]|nr:hypothetical protein [Silicimonas sp.]